MIIKKRLITEKFDIKVEFHSSNLKTNSLMGDNSETLGIIIDNLMTSFGISVRRLEQEMKK